MSEKKADSVIKFFSDENSFSNLKMRAVILGKMPDFASFQKGIQKIEKIKMEKINPEMMPCYKSPLLTKDQEVHLFRKFNYLKYKAKNLYGIEKDSKFFDVKKKLADHIYKKAMQTRNLIAESNFRLATQIMKHKKGNQDSNTESVLSDAYWDVLKAVEYFNWTLGLRFSTYATWVVKKNYFREAKNKQTNSEKLTFLDDSRAENIEDRNGISSEEKNQEARQYMVNKLITLLIKENIGTDRVRQAYVLENYFGVNGRQKLTLEQISSQIGVTKERVRQLKEKGLQWIRQKVNDLNLNMEDASYF